MIYTYKSVASSMRINILTCTREDGAVTTLTLTISTNGTGTYAQTGDFLLLPLGIWGLPLPTDDSIDNAANYSITLYDTDGKELTTITVGASTTIPMLSDVGNITFTKTDGTSWSLDLAAAWDTNHYILKTVSSTTHYPLAWKVAAEKSEAAGSLKGIRVTEGT